MKIFNIKVGKLRCNCYILQISDEVLVVDPGDNFEKIDGFIKNKKVLGILNTHSHFDHTGAIDELVNKYKIKVYNRDNLEEDKIYKIGSFLFEAIFTPGHSKDSVTFYFVKDDIMFCGDFIFNGSIGRCDLDGSDQDEMKKSLYRITKYSDDILLYPGHGSMTSLGYEKKYNPFFRKETN